jgi:NADH-quinone oxidoreductase subunit C
LSSPSESAHAATGDRFAEYASGLADRLGALDFVAEFETVRIYVERDAWVETLRRARDEEDLVFFSWLSAIDWSRESTVGEGVDEPDELDERFEVICRLSLVESADAAQFIAEVPKADPVIDSVVPLFGGAAWHEREAAEMFGIEFRGHPNLTKLYLPDAFVGYPLRKSYALASREIKPWPGTVDVEAMPSTENVDAGEGGGES